MPPKIAVIGIGNTLRRDDGIGIVVLESLLEFHKRQGIDYLNFGSASFDLLHRIKNYDVVLLIDGINAGLKVGELKISKLEDIEYELDSSFSSTHETNLKSLFGLSRDLGIKTKIYLAGIQVGDTSFGEGLSEGLMKKKEGIVKDCVEFLDRNSVDSHRLDGLN